MPEVVVHERNVTFPSAGFALAGTFVVPEVPGNAVGARAAVLLLPGSGQTDRDDSAQRLAINAFPPIVQALADLRVATLRYDKRGVAASEGDYWHTGFDDRLADAVAAVRWLRAQPEIDPSRVFALGHSEGALLAIRLAAGGAPLAGIMLLAASAKTGEQTLRWQGAQIAASLSGFPKAVLRVLRIDPLRSQDRVIARVKASTGDAIRVQLVQKLNAKWMREFLAYDPAPDLAKIRVRVLAITGSKDIQVDPADLDLMAAAVPGPFEPHCVPEVTHLLRADRGAPGVQAYKRQVRQDVDPRVIEYVSTWMKEHAGGATV